ncbi:MAG: metallophosphoesterase family protein, partial [Gammaproteobacteria bacterium]|nr:metallophosphoesterase family protein [Gammaproteobacteria bacterium]
MYKWVKRVALTLLTLGLLYGAGRFIHVYSDSFYDGERAPYIMMPAATAITIRWQSEQAYRGLVRYGLKADELNNKLSQIRADKKHELRLTGLQPATRYYYSIGSETETAYAGSDYWFMTTPEAGATLPVRFAVLGDPGYPNPVQNEVRDSLLEYLAEHSRENLPYLDLLLTTGDNAYTSGSNDQFQSGFFLPYINILRNIPVWPVYGNHDARRWVFYNIFTFPQQAESGGQHQAR